VRIDWMTDCAKSDTTLPLPYFDPCPLSLVHLSPTFLAGVKAAKNKHADTATRLHSLAWLL